MRGHLEPLSPEPWLIRESGWDPSRQGFFETALALGSGLIGARAALEEKPEGAVPGTYFAGVFDGAGSLVPELVNAPDPFRFKLLRGGEKIGAGSMDILEYERVLDMRKAVLFRRTVFRSALGPRFEYRSARFLSEPAGAAVMRVEIRPLDGPDELEVLHGVDDAAANEGLSTEGSKRHYRPSAARSVAGGDLLCVDTLEGGHRIAYASSLTALPLPGGRLGRARRSVFRMKVGRAGAAFVKIVSFRSAPPGSSAVGGEAVSGLRKAARKGYSGLLREHVRAWDVLWRDADVEIAGDARAAKSARFVVYHLLICGTERASVGIGAKSLSGEGYRGHSFWDTEIFTLPFYVLNRPSAARRLLRYRLDRLDAARKIAVSKGYKGAMFPWESAGTGAETTPPWVRGPGGRVIPIETGLQEHHITADIAYGLMGYVDAAADERLLLEGGLELLLETARFWASRVERGRGGRLDITGVIGPDEFHENVGNNAFTNRMAAWNLRTSARVYRDMLKSRPRAARAAARKVRLKPGEPAAWERIAGRIAVPRVKDGVIEQFDGFFRRRRVRFSGRDRHGMPLIPRRFRGKDPNPTQLIKQADVVLLMYLFPGEFSAEAKRRNFSYYEARTLHKSSLSPSIHSIMALATGDRASAYRYLLASLRMDLEDVNGNTAQGMHIACCGGAWQALVHGFGGVSFGSGALSVDPRLPRGWKSLAFSLKWKGRDIRVKAGRRRVELSLRGGRPLSVLVRGAKARLVPGKPVSVPESSGA